MPHEDSDVRRLVPDHADPDSGAFGMKRPGSRSGNRDVTPRNPREGRNGAGASHDTMGGRLRLLRTGPWRCRSLEGNAEASRLNREVGRAEVGAAVEEANACAFGAACDGERSLMRRDMPSFAEERGR